MYRHRTRCYGAVVHLHSTHSVAVQHARRHVDPDRRPAADHRLLRHAGRAAAARPLLPAQATRRSGPAVEALAGKHHAVLLANHGPVVAGTSLEAAVYATEELEETAKIFLMLHGRAIRPLTREQVEEIRAQATG